MSLKNGILRCDWREECNDKVTHIGEKGWVYCKAHVSNRRGVERTRKLLVRERKTLERGEPLASFDRAPEVSPRWNPDNVPGNLLRSEKTPRGLVEIRAGEFHNVGSPSRRRSVYAIRWGVDERGGAAGFSWVASSDGEAVALAKFEEIVTWQREEVRS